MTPAFTFVLLAAVAVIAVILSGPLIARRRRRRILAAPLPKPWQQILEQRMPAASRMPAALRARWHDAIKLFIADKGFVGCGGLTITDEMRVLIAAQACLLVLTKPDEAYAGVEWILVYPGAFRVPQDYVDEDGVATVGEAVLAGESWDSGRVIVSWQDVLDGLHYADGDNVVLHEFAHQLDQASGVVNGAPLLQRTHGYSTWTAVLGEAFEGLRERAARGDPGVIDDYGASDPGEFFAVATEAFFETPLAMRREHPALYRELSAYYGVDPAGWLPPPAS